MYIKCTKCDGQGHIEGKHTCEKCQGVGMLLNSNIEYDIVLNTPAPSKTFTVKAKIINKGKAKPGKFIYDI